MLVFPLCSLAILWDVINKHKARVKAIDSMIEEMCRDAIKKSLASHARMSALQILVDEESGE